MARCTIEPLARERVAITLATRQVQLSREAGALARLQFALNFLGSTRLLSGDLAEAGRIVDEDRLT